LRNVTGAALLGAFLIYFNDREGEMKMAVDWKKMGLSFLFFLGATAALKMGKKVVASVSPQAADAVNKIV